jgi:hypothetical protein
MTPDGIYSMFLVFRKKSQEGVSYQEAHQQVEVQREAEQD